MAKLFDAQGNEIEAFTQEELKAKQDEAVAAYLKEHPDQSETLKKAQTDLEAATAKLKELEEGGGGNANQKERLKKERDEALQTVEGLKEHFTKEISDLKANIFGSFKTKALDKLSGGDAELRKKIETEYDGFAGEASTEQDIQARLTKAYTLAKGTPPAPNFMDGMSSSGERGVDQNHGVNQPPTENAKAIQKALGITDEQAEKFAPKPEGQK